MATAGWFERIGAGDAQALASDVGPVPMNVGALILLGPALNPQSGPTSGPAAEPTAGPALDPAHVHALLAQRLSAVPRMRQRLLEVPLGCGRPVWVDDPAFDSGRHVEVVRCPAPADRRALLDLAVALVTAPLDREHPLWRATVITGLPDGRSAVVVAFHHVLADGIGGLAVLGTLVDPTTSAPPTAPTPSPARPAPTRGQLRAEALRARRAAVRRLPTSLAALGAAARELGSQRPHRAPRSSLTVPTGPRRRVDVVPVPLTAAQEVARSHGATINDLLLTAVSGALEALLDSRGESVPELVVSVPVSARAAATTTELGNRTGVMPVRVPLELAATARLEAVARITAAQRGNHRGASAALVTPTFRALAAVGLFRPMIDRQRLVHSFLTNLRGPGSVLRLAGTPILEAVPITSTAGNVTVAFAALSYAGTLAITIIVDPDAVPEADLLARALSDHLAALGVRPLRPLPRWT